MERLPATKSFVQDSRKSHEHMLEVCYIHGTAQPRSSRNEDLLLHMKVIQSDCIVMISDDCVQLVPFLAADQINLTSAFMTGTKYVIEHSNVSDISILGVRKDARTAQVVGVRVDTEPQRNGIIMYLRDGSECRMDINRNLSARFAKHLQYTWQSWLVRESACVPTLSATANIIIAKDYLAETLNSLRSCSEADKFSTKVVRKQQIFEEFHSEVLSDLQLKNASCQSREIFIVAVDFCNHLTQSLAYSPASNLIDEKTSRTITSTKSNSSSSNSSSNSNSRQSTPRCVTKDSREGVMSAERKMRLHATALQRLTAVRSVLKALVVTLLGSETCAGRIGLLRGPEPMSMESWCSLLTLDPYLEICRTLGCSPETEEEQVALALNQSIHFDSSVVPSTMSSDTDTDSDRNRGIDFLQFSNLPCKLRTPIPRHTQRDGFAPPVSALWEKTKGDLVSSSILNPYLLRSVLKSDELESLSFVLVETRRSVRDLQAVLLLQLTQIAAAHGPPSLSPSLSSAHSHCHAHPPLHSLPRAGTMPSTSSSLSTAPTTSSSSFSSLSIPILGTVYTDQAHWRDHLEELVTRILTLLDDILSSTSSRTKVPKNKVPRNGRFLKSARYQKKEKKEEKGEEGDSRGREEEGEAGKRKGEGGELMREGRERDVELCNTSMNTTDTTGRTHCLRENNNREENGREGESHPTVDPVNPMTAPGPLMASTLDLLEHPAEEHMLVPKQGGEDPVFRSNSTKKSKCSEEEGDVKDQQQESIYGHGHERGQGQGQGQGRGRGRGQGVVSDHRIFNSSSFVSGFSQTVLKSSQVTVPPSRLSPSSSSSWRHVHTSSSRCCADDCTDRASSSSSPSSPPSPSSSSSSSSSSVPSPSRSPREMNDRTSYNRISLRSIKNLKGPKVSHSPRAGKGPYKHHDQQAGREEAEGRIPLETQEILLFYSLSLLHMLALDSYKIRAVLRDDLSSYMISIIHILNTICPRPTDTLPMSNKVEKHGMCGSTNLPHIGKSHQSYSSSNRVVNSDSSIEASPLPSPSSPTRPHSGTKQSILGILRSSMSHKKSLVEEQCEINDTNSNIRCKGGERNMNRRKVRVRDSDGSRVSGNYGDGDRSRVTDISGHRSGVTGATDAEYTHQDDECPLVRAFGSRKYGMSQSTWTLIILSRRCAHEVTVM